MKNLLIVFLVIILKINLSYSQVNIESKRAKINNKETKFTSELGIDLNKGAVKELEYKLNIRLDKMLNKENTILSLFDYSYGEAKDEKFKNELFFHTRLTSMILLERKIGFEIFVQSQKNEFMKLNLRQLLGTIIRLQTFSISNFNGFLGIGVMKEWESIEKSKDNNDIRLTNYITFILENKEKYKIFNTTYYQPLIKNTSDYRVNSEIAIIFMFTKVLGLKNSVKLLYDSNPPPEVDKLNNSIDVDFVIEY
tara:strand:+ start:437 stop:1192 length:756 start_codon:yes stop_codon:yes gene_type:complete